MNRRLAAKKILTMEDLYGETLILPKKGMTPYMNPLRHELEEKYPQIHIRSLDLELSAFNQIVSSDELIVSAECWKDVHPLLVTLPIR